MNIYIHHFLLFSDSPDDTFNLIQEEYNLRLGFPLSNFGFFKSGMLWMKNSYLEIVNYPKDIPAPNSNQSKCRFVGIALKTDLNPDQTKEFLNSKSINCSEILDEEVLDRDGKKILIAKIIILNDYFQDFRVFFVFHTNDFFDKKDEELSNMQCSKFKNCCLSVKNSSKIVELFLKLEFILIRKNILKTSKEQQIQIKESKNSSTEINFFYLQTSQKEVDIITNSKIWN